MVAQVFGLEFDLARANRMPPAEFDQRAIHVVDRLDGGVDAGHGMAVELHLLAHVPVERARHQPLPALHQRVQQAAAARIHGADGRHFAQRGVARVHQRHQVRQRRLPRRRQRSPDGARARGRAPRAGWRSAQRFPRFRLQVARDHGAQSAARREIADHGGGHRLAPPAPRRAARG